MSRFNDPTVRPMFASKTKFDALTVDSGEESEETTEPETTTTGRFVTQSLPKLSCQLAVSLQQEPEKPTKSTVSSDTPPIGITTEDPPSITPPSITSTNVPVPEAKEDHLEKYLPPNGSAMSLASDIQVSRPDPETAKKRQNVLTRILWTFIMIGGFIGNYLWTKCSQIYPLIFSMQVCYSLDMPT